MIESDGLPANDFERALVYAAQIHAGQERKRGGIPYVSHLLGVASLVLEHGGDLTQATAALLHDAAEDQGGEERLADIERRFGPKVAAIVEGCTDTLEDPKPDWLTRKEAYIAKLPGEPPETLRVSLADKLHNARTILLDFRSHGDEIFDRFAGKKDGALWYYRALVDVFRAVRHFASPMIDELDRVVTEIEDLASGA